MAETLSLEDLARSITRQWRLMLVVVVVALGASVAVNQLWPLQFEATAVITVEPTTVGLTSTSNDAVNMDTERVVASSTEVLRLASEKLGGPTPAQLRDGLMVTVPKGAKVLSFDYTAPSAEAAAAGANAIAAAYREHRVATAKSVVDEASAGLTAGIEEISTEAATLASDSPVRATLETQIQALQERQALLRSASFNAGSLVSPAVEPSESTKPSVAVIVAAGLFVGLFIGSFIALIRARFQRERTHVEAVGERAEATAVGRARKTRPGAAA